MAGIYTMGEILVEIMRPRVGMLLDQPGEFLGPFPSGAPAIFIDTVARLGHPAGMIGGVGEDDFGRCVIKRLVNDGVDCRYVKRYPYGATAVAFVTYFEDGSRKFLYHIDRTPAVWGDFEGIKDLDKPDFFHVMGCSLMANEFFRDNIFKAVRVAHDQGAKISFDPNIRPELLRNQDLNEVVEPVLEHCAVLLPGLAELAMLSGEHTPDRGAASLFSRYPLEIILLKRGKKGCTIITRETSQDVPAYRVDEVDPTGSGDCFDAGFICGLVEGRSLENCAKIAAAAGAINAAAFGPMEGKISRQAVADMTGLHI